ncbi:MAG: hypothetical protein IJW43_06575 [Clostridia bacterium]|nr:hypothetical protein [Clostridia bacterium]
MTKKKKSLSTNTLITALVYAVIGVLLVVLRGGSLDILMTIVGALFVILGVFDALKSNTLMKGIIEIGIGVAIIVCGWLIADIVLLVFGVLLVVKSAIDIFKNIKSSFSQLLPAIICLVIGIMLIVSKWALLDLICLITGIFFIVNAVLVFLGKKI